jgi:hypothetical protein
LPQLYEDLIEGVDTDQSGARVLDIENDEHRHRDPAPKLELFRSGTLMRSATGFCVCFASFSSARPRRPLRTQPGKDVQSPIGRAQ